MLKWISSAKYTLISMFTVFKHLFKKPVTLEYPEKRLTPPEQFRGKPVVKNCVGCKTCIKVCPAKAITIQGDEVIFDLKKCIFCGNCKYYCPKGAVELTSEYELGSDDKSSLILSYKLNNGGADE